MTMRDFVGVELGVFLISEKWKVFRLLNMMLSDSSLSFCRIVFSIFQCIPHLYQIDYAINDFQVTKNTLEGDIDIA